MKIAILAAGGKKWNRHEIEIGGETILHRTRRQLIQRGIAPGDIYISIGPDDPAPIITTTIVRNQLTGNDLGCIYGIKEYNFDLFLFGDVYFTDAAIDTILQEKTNFYARTKPGKVKNYGEMFAIRPDENLWTVLDRMWKEYKFEGARKRLWSWDLYSEIMGKDFYKHRNVGNMTEISDETEDFDKPEDVEAWKITHQT